MTVVSATGVATMGPRGAMAPSLLSYFSIVSMSWFTTSVHAPNVSCMLQLPEVHTFAWFVQYVWEIMVCVDHAPIRTE